MNCKGKRHEWKDGKKCAAMISVNLNAELFWLSLSPDCEKMPKTLSLGQYGMTRGLERILEALYERNLKATFFVPGKTAELYPEHVKEAAARGHEIACLGYANENMALLTFEEQKEAIEKGISAIKNCCGIEPAGFRAPDGEMTIETLKAAKMCGLKYSSSLMDDDRPYFKDLGDGEKLLEIPARWDNYDLPYFAFNYNPAFPAGQGRIANYSGVLSNWKDDFDGCREYGLCYVFQTDPAASGSPGRIEIFEELLGHICSFDDVWLATGSEILNYEAEKRRTEDETKERNGSGRDA